MFEDAMQNQIKLLAVLAASDTYNPYNLAVPKQHENIWHLYIRYITNDSTPATSLVIK